MSRLPENPGQSVQYDVQCDVQSEAVLRHVFDEELRDDWRNPLNDVPIPFRLGSGALGVEGGASIENIDPRGFVP